MTKRKIIALSIVGLLLLIIIGISIYIYVMTHKKVVKFSGEIEETSTLKEITSDTLDVESNTPKDVLYYSLWRVSNTKEFKVSSLGKSTAMNYTVNIKNERIVKDDEAMITIVYGGLLKNSTQHYFKNDKAYIRQTSNISKSLVPTFSGNDYKEYTRSEYIDLVGWFPFQAYGYILNDNTIEDSASLKKIDENLYQLDIELNMDSKAIYYYKREIAYNSNSITVPNFKYVNLSFTIDSNYYIRSVDIKEKYSVQAKQVSFLGEIDTVTKVTDTFTYDNIEFDSKYYDFYKENIKKYANRLIGIFLIQLVDKYISPSN